MIAKGSQIRAARGLLNWSRIKLAAAARLNRNSIARWESHDIIPVDKIPWAVARIEEALRKAGVETFINPAPGARLCNSPIFSRKPRKVLRPLVRFLQKRHSWRFTRQSQHTPGQFRELPPWDFGTRSWGNFVRR
jgi:hypothetical protein